MARTLMETEFSQRIGRIGEEEIAPKLLHKLGVKGARNLNHTRMNHPWADYLGQMHGEWVAVAVRTRVNWQKPVGSGRPVLRSGFGGAGLRKAGKAVELIRSDLQLPPDTGIRLLWLANAVDIDNTYEAYWGSIEEMQKRADGSRHLTIRMKVRDRAQYERDGRRIAWREPCEIPWDDFPEEWACPARARYLELISIADRTGRIETAIRTRASSGRPRLIAKTAPRAPRARPVKPAAKPRDLTPLLERCRNEDERAFFIRRLEAGQPTTDVGLSFWIGGRSRWCADLLPQWSRVVQKGTFPGDEDFWKSRLSAKQFVKSKRGGASLTFRLITAADFIAFEQAITAWPPTSSSPRASSAPVPEPPAACPAHP